MRKIILSACLFLCTIAACAQVTSSTGKPYTNFPGIDYVFMFNGITSSTDITYNGTGTNINWYKFSDPTTPISTGTKEIFGPEDATGYILDVDGKQTTIWVIDYKNYLPVAATTFEPDNNSASQCKDVTLKINPDMPLLSYKTKDNISHSIPRNCTINYNTLHWGGTAWQTKDTTLAITFPASQLSVPAPYCTTTFTLSGDQYATDLGIAFTIKSSSYTPVAVICKPTTNVTSREHDKNNEANAPSSALPIDFSAPIDVQFLSNANEPITKFYNWTIYNKDNKLLINRTDKDHRYTFTEAGSYKVKVTVSNETCSYSDSLTVNVTESAIYVPDVFTPNGDGYNDEFRVAYKSLISFQCWVYNRWGRQVYYWNDPTKGWDGNINGKKAVPGPYFYVIKAIGSDKKVYKLKGDINLLREVGK
ncbi:MAG: gliding motility-associated C-terminal domain-containing protein [Bacteroidota bacterium]|nr:gliding motility-associated C-terminal domain-containing protein [Bacteroidota bacterium]